MPRQLFDERDVRFRARRKVLWIGHGDKGSPLSPPPPSLVDAVVEYIDIDAAPAARQATATTTTPGSPEREAPSAWLAP